MKKLLDRIIYFLRRKRVRKGWLKGNDTPLEGGYAQHPFPGPKSYDEEGEEFFFGRDDEKNRILEILEYYSLCFLIGKSGIGKSSMVNAGIVPALKRKDFVPVIIRVDFDLETDLTDQVKTRIEHILKEVDPAIGSFNGRLLWEYFQQEKLFNGFMKPVLIFDQFEEIFTRGKAKQEQLIRLVRELIDLSENRVPEKVQEVYIRDRTTIPSYFQKDYRIIFVMREDYLPQLTGLRAYIPTLKYSVFRLEQMSWEHARDAVYFPTLKGNLMDESTAGSIMSKLPDIKEDEFEFSLLDEEPGTAATPSGAEGPRRSKRVEPFLLNLFCYTLNEERFQKNICQLKISDAAVKNKDFDLLVEDYYDQVTSERPGLSLAIEQELITPDGEHRKSSEKVQFRKAGNLSDDDVKILVNNRLIRRRSINDLEYYELIHDAFVRVVYARRMARRQVHQNIMIGLVAATCVIVSLSLTAFIRTQHEKDFRQKQVDLLRKDSILQERFDLAEQQTRLIHQKQQNDSKWFADSVKSLEGQKKADSELIAIEKQANRVQKDSISAIRLVSEAWDSLALERMHDNKRLMQASIDLYKSNQRIQRINFSQTLARSALYQTLSSARNSMALLAYDTLYDQQYGLPPGAFNADLYTALASAAPAKARLQPFASRIGSGARMTIESMFQSNHMRYYVCPSHGIETETRTFILDSLLVHAWININATRVAIMDDMDAVGSLVIRDGLGTSIGKPLRLSREEEMVSAIFDPGDRVCIFSTRSKSMSYLMRLDLLKPALPDTLLTLKGDQPLYILSRGNSLFNVVSAHGEVYFFDGYSATTKPFFSTEIGGLSHISAVCPAIGADSCIYLAHENGEVSRLGQRLGPQIIYGEAGPRGTVIALSANGMWLAVGGLNGDVAVWKLDSSRPARAFARRASSMDLYGGVAALYFSDKGDSLIAGMKSGLVYGFPLNLPELRAQICKMGHLLGENNWNSYIPNVNYRNLCQ